MAGKLGAGWVADGVFLSPVHCNATNNGGPAVNVGVLPGCNEYAGSGVENTGVWSTYGVYEHLWTPKWRTSLYGGFVGVDYDSTAKNWICNSASNLGPGNGGGPVIVPVSGTHQPNRAAALGTKAVPSGLISGAAGNGQTIPLGFGSFNNSGGQGILKSTSASPATINLPNTGPNAPTGQSAGVSTAYSSAIGIPAGSVFGQVQGTNTTINCNPSFGWAQIGTRTLWNPVPDVDVGLEFSWVHLQHGIFRQFGNDRSVRHAALGPLQLRQSGCIQRHVPVPAQLPVLISCALPRGAGNNLAQHGQHAAATPSTRCHDAINNTPRRCRHQHPPAISPERELSNQLVLNVLSTSQGEQRCA